MFVPIIASKQTCDIFVDAESSAAPPMCGSRASPCARIVDGITEAARLGKHHVCVQGGNSYERECSTTGQLISGSLAVVGTNFALRSSIRPTKTNTVLGCAQKSPTVPVIDCLGITNRVFVFQPLSSSSTLSLTNLAFVNAASIGGSALHSIGGSVEIKSCYFQDMHATQNGGAIQIEDATDFGLIDSKFCRCSAPNGSGGAVLLSQMLGTYSISGSSFSDCSAGLAGGALQAQAEGKSSFDLFFTSSNFTSNTVRNPKFPQDATYSLGGSASIDIAGPAENVHISFQGCHIQNSTTMNSVGSSGGALSIFFHASGTNVTTEILDSVITSNSAVVQAGNDVSAEVFAQGGGVWLQSVGILSNVTTDLSGSNISFNSVKASVVGDVSQEVHAHGGGAWIQHLGPRLDQVTTNLSNTQISNNSAAAVVEGDSKGVDAKGGGAVVVLYGNVVNSVTDLSRSVQHGNAAVAQVTGDAHGDVYVEGGSSSLV